MTHAKNKRDEVEILIENDFFLSLELDFVSGHLKWFHNLRLLYFGPSIRACKKSKFQPVRDRFVDQHNKAFRINENIISKPVVNSLTSAS